MPDPIGFEFPGDQAGQWDGFNEPGMEHFSGSPFEHLGREVPQNTIDAIISAPARIYISLDSVPVISIPGIEELKKTIRYCLAGAPNESKKAELFFKNALDLLAKDHVKVLQIADYNTSGVVGPCENGKPFFAMMKATGQSKKSGTSTGSYGIGKFAPFTVSELRTVFLTTVWNDGNKFHHYVQGKSILMSHMVGKKIRRGTGFWGVRSGCLPVDSIEGLPKWLVRADSDKDFTKLSGTTLSILGFAAPKNWQQALATNIAENFFGAICEGSLEVEIQGGPTINKNTLEEIFNDKAMRASVEEQRGEPDKFDNIKSYLRAFTDNLEVKVEETQNFHLGKCRLRILVGEGLPRKVAVLRNGMLITDELSRLKRFGPYKEFVAVLECRNDKGQALLRAMEPPRHDDFEPDRLPPEQRAAGRVALREIAKWVREMLDRHAKDSVSEVTTLDELADFFGDEEEGGFGKQKDENPGGAIVVRQRPVKFKARTATYGATAIAAVLDVDQEEEGEVDLEGFEDNNKFGRKEDSLSKGDKQSEPNEGKGNGQRSKESNPEKLSKKTAAIGVMLKDVRAVPIDEFRRRVAFTPTISGTVMVEIQDSGADANYKLDISNASLGVVNSGRIDSLNVKSGARVVIDIELCERFLGTLRVVVNAI